MSFTRGCIHLHAKGDKYNSRKMNEATGRSTHISPRAYYYEGGKKSYFGDVISQSGLCKSETKQKYIVDAFCVCDPRSADSFNDAITIARDADRKRESDACVNVS